MRDLLKPERVAESRELLGAEAVETLERVYLDALRVVEEVGFHCPSPRIREILEGTGLAAFDESTGHLHVLGDLCRQAIESTPKNDAFWVPFQSYGIGGTAPYFRDDETGELIEATPELVEKLMDTAEAAEAVAFSGRGVKLNGQNARAIRTMAERTTKTIYFGVDTLEEVELVEELYRQRGKMLVVWDVIQSPLTLSEHGDDVFLACVERGLPVLLASMPMPAVSAPYSMTGLLTMAFAEFLAGLAIIQTVRAGTTVVCGSFPSVTDIKRRYALDFGAPSHNLTNCLMSHVPRMLDLPACQSGCTTNEKDPTERALWDAAHGYGLFRRYGAHMIRHAFGFTKDLVAFSFEKFEKAQEVFARTGPEDAPPVRMPRYDEEGFEVIARNGSKANYMQDEHTLAHTGREFSEA